ncbi:hypothetical protein BGZ68_008542 [Mortierella alpina]|nr:hypothetical protein BGZ68_008542 [Mortierella alpina]
MDHEAVASRIAIIQEGSQDCDLWMAASNAAKAGALAVLFHSFSPDDSLLSSPLLPQGWELGDPLIPIPVLSVTHALGLTLLGNQSNMLLSIVTRNLMDEKEEHNGDDTIFGKIIATFHYIMGTISSTCNHIIDTIFAAVTWLWEYSKAVTLFVAAAFVPIALNAASSLATKTIEFGFKGVYATTLAVMGIFGRLFQMSRKSKATIPPNEGQAQAGEHVETTILSRGMFAPEREAAKSVNTAEIPQNHPIFNIYFVGASFIVGLVVGGCFAVAVMAATRPTPV